MNALCCCTHHEGERWHTSLSILCGLFCGGLVDNELHIDNKIDIDNDTVPEQPAAEFQRDVRT